MTNDRLQFRAWNKIWGMMLPVDKFDIENQSISVTNPASDYNHKNEWEDYEIEKDIILMQSTGLRDKNGKLIFEGDVMKTPYGNLEVIFMYGAFRFKRKLNHCPLVYYINKHWEVIGNVYENPNLINKSK